MFLRVLVLESPWLSRIKGHYKVVVVVVFLWL